MNVLINRLFQKESAKTKLRDPERDERIAFLDFLVEKSSKTKEILEISSRIDNERFDENNFLSNCKLVCYYLEIEHYLIYKDPRYINSQQKLRQEAAQAYPVYFKTKPFLPLHKNEKDQEAVFCFLFVYFMLLLLKKDRIFLDHSESWLGILNSKYFPGENLNIVERINLIQNLRRLNDDIYDKLKLEKGIEFAQNHFVVTHKSFMGIYPKFKSIKAVNDIIPVDQGEEKEEKPVKKLISLTPKPTTAFKANFNAYTSVFQNMLDSIVLFNHQGKIHLANNSAVKMFGKYESSLEDKNIFNYLPSPFLQALKEDIENIDSVLPSSVLGKRFETVLFKGTEKEEDVEITVTNNFTKPEKTFTLFMKNVGHKKHMLEAIQKSKIHAERVAKAKSTFLSNMSHEIRTPLNVILGLTEILKKTDTIDEEILQKNLDGIDFSAKNLLSIVNDILDFSKIEAGKLTLQAIDFNLKKIIESLAEGFKIKAQEKGLELTVHFEENVPDIVIGDQYRLNQILNNLIGNAIKFTKHGNIHIGIKLFKENLDDLILQISVKDTGIGISKENLEKIFDSFYQADTLEGIGGTGLGLAITRELLYLHNGEFKVESDLGKGSNFICTIPYKKSTLSNTADSAKSYAGSAKKLDGLKVLVAEDNQMNQFYIKQLLDKLNVVVEIAENGKEALDMLASKEDTYDLVLMDLHMPVMNGMEAIYHIRKLNSASVNKIPIVACSADVFPDTRKNAIKSGIDFYLTKPLSEDAIKEVLYWLVSDKDEKKDEPQKKLVQIEPKTQQPEKSAVKNTIALSTLLKTFENDSEFVISLLEVFKQTTPEDYNNLGICIDREYYTRASELAHKLKSSFMNLGLTVHGHHLQQIEKAHIKKRYS